MHVESMHLQMKKVSSQVILAKRVSDRVGGAKRPEYLSDVAPNARAAQADANLDQGLYIYIYIYIYLYLYIYLFIYLTIALT